MSTMSPTDPSTRTVGSRIAAFPITRIVLAAIATILPVALILIVTHFAVDKSFRAAWPQVLAGLACVVGYRFYVRKIEKRALSELAPAGAVRELAAGGLIGAALLVSALGIIAVTGAYRIVGAGAASVLLPPLAEMFLVAIFEEIFFRGIIFRIIENALGSWATLLIAAAIFAVAHLPNADISLLAVLFTFVAGLVLTAAYLVD